MKTYFSTHVPLALAAVAVSTYIFLVFLSPWEWMQERVGTVGVALVCIIAILFVLWPTNFRFIRIRSFGVLVRFGRVQDGENDVRGEGPQHIMSVFGDRLIVLPAHDQVFTVTFKFLTGGDVPQDIEVTFAYVLRIAKPIFTVTNVPRHEPIVAFEAQLQAAARTAVQSMTIDQLLNVGGGDALSIYVSSSLRENPLLERWGLQLISIEIADINPNVAVIEAAAKRYGAKAEADATVIYAEGEVQAVKRQRDGQGDDMFVLLEGLQTAERMAKAGAFQTFAALGGLVDAIGSLITGNARKEQ